MSRAILLAACALLLSACATVHDAKRIPPPKTFLEALDIQQGEITAIRATTVFVLDAKGVNCNINDPAATPYSDLCVAARKIRDTTRQYRDKLDTIREAYLGVHEMMYDCKIEYAGQQFACEDQYDEIVAGLLELQKLLPQGTKK